MSYNFEEFLELDIVTKEELKENFDELQYSHKNSTKKMLINVNKVEDSVNDIQLSVQDVVNHKENHTGIVSEIHKTLKTVVSTSETIQNSVKTVEDSVKEIEDTIGNIEDDQQNHVSIVNEITKIVKTD